MAASALEQATLDTLDDAIEIEMLTPRRDGSTSSRAIWVVVVGGEAYVRSYRGEGGAWYRRARADGTAAVGVDGRTIEVGVEPVENAEVNRQVSEAYRDKYGKRSPRPTETMVGPEVSATTLRLTHR